MARLTTLVDLRQRIRDRGEVRAQYVTHSMLVDWINESLASLHDLILSVNQDYYLETQTITVVSGTGSYVLPANYYRTRGVDVLFGATFFPMLQYVFSERNRLQDFGSIERNTKYRIMGNNFTITPAPTFAGTIRHYYIPTPRRFSTTCDETSGICSADGESFDGINGWEEFVVSDCLAKAAEKEETDPTPYLARKNEAIVRIRNMASTRNDAEPDNWRDITEEQFGLIQPNYYNP